MFAFIKLPAKGTAMFENKKIAVLGAGKLGEALITGMLDAGIVAKKQFIATAASRRAARAAQKKLGLKPRCQMAMLSASRTSSCYA